MRSIRNPELRWARSKWAMPEQRPSSSRPNVQDIAATFDGNRLRQARQLALRTKHSLAGPFGVSAAAIGQYESGVTRPRPEAIPFLARELESCQSFSQQGDPKHGSKRVRRSSAAFDRQRQSRGTKPSPIPNSCGSSSAQLKSMFACRTSTYRVLAAARLHPMCCRRVRLPPPKPCERSGNSAAGRSHIWCGR